MTMNKINLFDFVYLVVLLYEFFFGGDLVSASTHLCAKRSSGLKNPLDQINNEDSM